MRRRRSYSEPVGVRSKVGHFNRPKWDINSDAYIRRRAPRWLGADGTSGVTASLLPTVVNLTLMTGENRTPGILL